VKRGAMVTRGEDAGVAHAAGRDIGAVRGIGGDHEAAPGHRVAPCTGRDVEAIHGTGRDTGVLLSVATIS
jgi:hypothetical protein